MRVDLDEILNSFAEAMSSLMIDQYHEHWAELDVTLPQAHALRILRRGALTTGQLGCQLRISAPAITQLTNRLIRKGLIERTAAADDRRCVIVGLSTTGQSLVDGFRNRRRELFDIALSHLDVKEQSDIVEALQKVVALLESHNSGNGGPPPKSPNGHRGKSGKRVPEMVDHGPGNLL